jgi:hypothetical protein
MKNETILRNVRIHELPLQTISRLTPKSNFGKLLNKFINCLIVLINCKKCKEN